MQVMNDVKVGLVCFRLIGSNELNKKLLTTINASGRLHMVTRMVVMVMVVMVVMVIMVMVVEVISVDHGCRFQPASTTSS